MGTDASADDVKAILNENVSLLTKDLLISPGRKDPTLASKEDHLVDMLKGVRTKVILDILGHLHVDHVNDKADLGFTDNQNAYRDTLVQHEAQILLRAIRINAKEADVPDLLASDSVYGNELVGPGVVFRHPAWCNSPAGTACLSDILEKIESDPSNSTKQFGTHSVLEVANLNHDPTIQALLKGAISSACASANAPGALLLNAYDAATASTDPSIHALLPSIVSAMAASKQFEFDRSDTVTISWGDDRKPFERSLRLTESILAGTAPLSDANFVAAATTILSKGVGVAGDVNVLNNMLALALLGDPKAFTTSMTQLFGLPLSSLNNRESAKSETQNTPPAITPWMISEITKTLLPAIVYHGPGNKTQAVKDHFQEAIYQNGQWMLTLTGSEAPSSASSDLPTPPVTSNSADSPLSKTPELASDSALEDVKKAVELYAGQMKSDSEVAAVSQQLHVVKVKVLLALLGDSFLTLANNDSQAELTAKEFRKEILWRAIDFNVSEVDVSDLIASRSEYGYHIMVKHPVWCNSETATDMLFDELHDLQTELATYNYRIDAGPSLLEVASLNLTPAIQTLLQETIWMIAQKPANPTLLYLALTTASKSDNPAIHNQIPDLVAALAHLHDPGYDLNFADYLYRQLSYVIERNPLFLKNPDFIANATALAKTTGSFPGVNVESSVPLALLGDRTAFGDSLEKYYASKATLPAQQTAQTADVEKWLISSIVYRGTGDKQQDIQNHYREAVYQNGQWLLTMPGYVPPSSTQTVSSAPPEAPASPTGPPPTSVTVTAPAPTELLDSSGRVTAVAMAAVGTTYTLVRVDGDKLLLKDSSGNQYHLSISATNYEVSQK